MNLSEKEREFIVSNVPDASTLLANNNKRELLIALGDFINEKGFAPPDFYDYNDLGREAQKVYDNIYVNN